jgi:hypothetical protein
MGYFMKKRREQVVVVMMMKSFILLLKKNCRGKRRREEGFFFFFFFEKIEKGCGCVGVGKKLGGHSTWVLKEYKKIYKIYWGFVYLFLFFFNVHPDFSLFGIILLSLSLLVLDLLHWLLLFLLSFPVLLIGGAEKVQVQKTVHFLYPKTSEAYSMYDTLWNPQQLPPRGYLSDISQRALKSLQVTVWAKRDYWSR